MSLVPSRIITWEYVCDLSEAWARHDREPFLDALADLAARALHHDSLSRDLLRQQEELYTLDGKSITMEIHD
jgi:hypothetical protein